MGLWDTVKGAVGGAVSSAGNVASSVAQNPYAQGALGVLSGGTSTLAGQAMGAAGLGNALGVTSKGGVQNPLASPDNAAAARGTPRAGVGPNQDNYALGGDPNYNAQFQQNQQQVAGQGQNLSQNAMGVGAQGQGLMSAGNAASNRGGPVTQYDPRVSALQNQNAAGGQSQYQLADQLQTLAGQPQGPSAAQAQLNMGTDQALNSQMAMARSGSGFGESSGAMQQAQQNAAGIQSNAANQAGMLRANEDQAFKARQLQALGMSGEQLGQARGADLALSGQQIGQGQFGTQTDLAARAQNDSAQQNLINSGLQAQNMGLSGQAAGISAQNQSNQLALEAARAEQQGGQAYEQNVTDIYGMDQAAHDRARELNQQKSNDWVQGITGGVSALTSLASLSDRRSKKNVETEDLSRVYRALGGK